MFRVDSESGAETMRALTEHFEDLPDPRVDRTKKHSLRDILVLTVLAVICSADSIVDIEAFGRSKEAWLRTFLDLGNGVPSHDTIGRVLASLDPDAFSARFIAWISDVAKLTDGEVIAIDGKTVRRSMDRAGNRGPIHIVSAWAAQNGLVLGQVKTAEKSNEITAIPELLRVLDIAGCIVTIDAMGCQRAIADQIVEQGGDYMLMLKANHPRLLKEVEGFFHDGAITQWVGIEHDFHEQVDRGHDRVEIRRVWTTPDLVWLPEADDWSGMKSLVCVESERTVTGKPTSVSRRYYLCSLDSPTAEAAARIVRSHWGVENRLHWVLDVAFREDESRARVGHVTQNLAMVRKIALNLLKQERSVKTGIRAKRLRAGWDESYLRKVLGN